MASNMARRSAKSSCAADPRSAIRSRCRCWRLTCAVCPNSSQDSRSWRGPDRRDRCARFRVAPGNSGKSPESGGANERYSVRLSCFIRINSSPFITAAQITDDFNKLLAELSLAKTTTAAAPVATDALGQLFDLLSTLQIPREKVERYAKKKYGAGWNRNPNGIRRVLSAVEAFKSNRGGLLAAVEVELDVIA